VNELNFLTVLRDDIRSGLSHASPEYRAKHGAWLAARQQPSGGFANRRGRADLYYSAFALRALSALNALTTTMAEAAGQYLLTLSRKPDVERLRQPAGAFCDAVAAVSWWDSLALCEEQLGRALLEASERAQVVDVTVTRLNALRREDGGFAKTDIDIAGSLYHTFLAGCALLRMGAPFPEPERARAFLESMEQPGGGFLENRFSKKPGTNGCAAAISLSVLLDVDKDMSRHAEFLASMHSSEGGFYATPAAPIADLLSSYTALFTLKLLGAAQPRLTATAWRYARTLEDAAGGYTGFALETVVDCEYTFYGLGVESIALAAAAS